MKKLFILLSLLFIFSKSASAENFVFHNLDVYVWVSNDRAPTATEDDLTAVFLDSWRPIWINTTTGNIYQFKGGSNGSYIWDLYITDKNVNSYLPSKVFNNNVSRSLNSNFTISSARETLATYSINVAWNLSALLSGSATAFLEYSVNGGSSWIIVSQVSKSIGLLTFAGADDLNLSGNIPANVLTRIRTTTSNMTVTYTRGQEFYY